MTSFSERHNTELLEAGWLFRNRNGSQRLNIQSKKKRSNHFRDAWQNEWGEWSPGLGDDRDSCLPFSEASLTMDCPVLSYFSRVPHRNDTVKYRLSLCQSDLHSDFFFLILGMFSLLSESLWPLNFSACFRVINFGKNWSNNCGQHTFCGEFLRHEFSHIMGKPLVCPLPGLLQLLMMELISSSFGHK